MSALLDHVRVFVSSTFRDLFPEREELIKRIFPRLRRLYEERGLPWAEIDLRWGITEQQARQGEILPLCLAEIDRCRPFFLGILGDRYGWIPETIPEDLLEQHPWLRNHLGASVTELEILHGALNDPARASQAYFYLRVPAGPSEDPAQAALKERIRRSGLPVREFSTPESLGELVFQDLLTALEQVAPARPATALEREASEHEAFAASRTAVYVARPSELARVGSHAAGTTPPLVITGEPGSGKSALLANWARQATDRGEVVLTHFVGASPASADWAAMLRRILGEMKRRFSMEEEIPTTPDGLRAAFPRWLAEAPRFVLILDGLDRLEDRDGALQLAWLPTPIPAHVRLILAAAPGPALQALRQRGWPSLSVAPLASSDREAMIAEYLRGYGKGLDQKRLQRLVRAKQTANPLFLRVILEELRVFGVHEQLDERIDHYLAAPDIANLYERILTRYEADYDPANQGWVRQALSLIWVARRGLSESELLDMLGTSDAPFPSARWAPLHLSAGHAFFNSAGLLRFAQAQIRDAVERRYLPDPESKIAAHQRLAGYFASRPVSERKFEELPWQQQQAGLTSDLQATLSDLDLLAFGRDDSWEQSRKFDWLRYCRAVSEPEQWPARYAAALDQVIAREGETARTGRLAHILGWLVSDLGHWSAALPFHERALAIREKLHPEPHPEVAESLYAVADLVRVAKNPHRAREMFKRALAIRQQTLGADDLAVAQTYHQMAAADSDLKDFATAERHRRLALEIRERHLGPDHPLVASTCTSLGAILAVQGRLPEAIQLTERALKIRESQGQDHPKAATVLNNLAVLCVQQGRLKEALKYAERALVIQEKKLGPEHPETRAFRSNRDGIREDLEQEPNIWASLAGCGVALMFLAFLVWAIWWRSATMEPATPPEPVAEVVSEPTTTEQSVWVWLPLALAGFMVSLVILRWYWLNFTASGLVYVFLEGGDEEAAQARDRLLRMGQRARPALDAWNTRLIDEYVAQQEMRRSVDPRMLSGDVRAYGYAIARKQSRLVDLMREIASPRNPTGGEEPG